MKTLCIKVSDLKSIVLRGSCQFRVGCFDILDYKNAYVKKSSFIETNRITRWLHETDRHEPIFSCGHIVYKNLLRSIKISKLNYRIVILEFSNTTGYFIVNQKTHN